jgi:hypothetical protein
VEFFLLKKYNLHWKNIPEFSIFKVVLQKVPQKSKNSPPKTNHWLVVVE